MQELRFVAVSEDGSYAVLAVPGRSGRYVLPIDERLRAIANGQTSRLAQYEIEVESPLRPKEIQARIRAGETAEEIADAAGIPVERVRWFEGPVLAERAYIADQAQAASVRRAGDSGPGPRLGDIVPARLTASGADPEDAQWDARKRGDGNWQVTLSFPSAGRVHIAEWVFDPRRRHAMPDDDNAARLSLPESELPPEPVAVPGEATVTPLAPRLGAAAGMGGGGVSMGGPGGFAGGSGAGVSGAGVRSFRPERSVIPDRSLGADRTLAAERSPGLPRPGQDHAVHSDRPAFRGVTPESAPYFAAEPAPHRAPEPASRRAPDLSSRRAPEPVPDRDPAPEAMPEPAPHRDPMIQEPPRPRGPGFDRPAQPRPVIFEDAEPAATLPDHQPDELGEQLELAPPAAAAGPETPVALSHPVALPHPAAVAPQAPEATPAVPSAPVTPEVPAADAAEAAPEPAADDQSARPRPGSKKNAKGRRSSVPSWDEIMLGSSRQRE